MDFLYLFSQNKITMKSLFLIFLLLHFSIFSQDKIVEAQVISDNEINILYVSPDSFPQVSIVFEALKNNLPIFNLNKSSIEVYEDDKPCDILKLSSVTKNLTFYITMIIDHSGSMQYDPIQLIDSNTGELLPSVVELNGEIIQFPDNYISPLEKAKSLSKQFVKDFDLNKDKFQVIGFSNSVDIKTSFYSDTNLIFNALDSMKVDSSTAFYDAISAGLDATKNGISIIVALTDGNDNSSSTSIRKVIRKSKKSNTPLILIGLGEVDVELLNELADKTNGRFYHAKNTLELNSIYRNIQNQIKSIYDLKYSSESLVFEDSTQQINLSFKIDSANYVKRNIKYSVPEIAYEYIKKKQKKRKTKLLAAIILAAVIAGGISYRYKFK
jgi:hypothetical protein